MKGDMIRLKLIIGFIVFFGVCKKVDAQVEYAIKIETGFLNYHSRTVEVDPGINWKGYNLDEEENGIDFSIINGILFKQKLFLGVGLSYLNFEGINGVSVFSDIEYLPLKTRLTPLVNIKIGHSHIWNQYENGTGTGLLELCLGLNFRLTDKIGIYAKSGYTFTQESLLTPIKLGVRL